MSWPGFYLKKADEDAEVVFRVPDEVLAADSVFGFHAQQAVEKLLKAVLAARAVAFRRTHQIRELMVVLDDAGIPIPPDLADLDELTPFAVEFRYDDVPVGEEPALDRPAIRDRVRRLRAWIESILSP